MSKTTPPGVTESEEMPRALALAFAPIQKRALGVATGVAVAVLIAGLTLITHLLPEEQHSYLSLLAQYFFGYSVSLQGAVIGALWGFFVGFVAGWFFAFCRNLAIAAIVFITRTRAELAATRDFLDHI